MKKLLEQIKIYFIGYSLVGWEVVLKLITICISLDFFGNPYIIFGKTSDTITGYSGDSVYLGADSTTWSAAGSVHDGADSYMVYVNTHAQLLISDKVQINLF